MDRTGGLGARLETAALAWILLGTLLIVGLVAAFGWPWSTSASAGPVPPHATGWVCFDTNCWTIDGNGNLIAPLHKS